MRIVPSLFLAFSGQSAGRRAGLINFIVCLPDFFYLFISPFLFQIKVLRGERPGGEGVEGGEWGAGVRHPRFRAPLWHHRLHAQPVRWRLGDCSFFVVVCFYLYSTWTYATVQVCTFSGLPA